MTTFPAQRPDFIIGLLQCPILPRKMNQVDTGVVNALPLKAAESYLTSLSPLCHARNEELGD